MFAIPNSFSYGHYVEWTTIGTALLVSSDPTRRYEHGSTVLDPSTNTQTCRGDPGRANGRN